ncbi:O-methyltransferase [Olivibacter sp. XZL3]|uniref:O-methyltransferase n=1 Tax=Olivibacter sp. XZL3 TaxID=1735116 RepID=UPI001064FB93|nr:class I SAM-dependent methyltransferase [Olivibacter sp. XZL3]
MNQQNIPLPPAYEEILAQSRKLGFPMLSDVYTGSLLRTLVASKPAGRFLELGTGTGLALSWIVEAMNSESTVVSVDNNELYQSVAKHFFGTDPRVELICTDGNQWIVENQQEEFDLIFADTWPGKYSVLEETLAMLKPGGFYLIDDMLPQPNWPEGHPDNVDKLIAHLEQRSDIQMTKMNWSTGLIFIAKK